MKPTSLCIPGVSICLCLAVGCATVSTPVVTPVRPAADPARSVTASAPAKVLKRRIAVARFSNETRYGRGLITDPSQDPLGKQASDMLYNRLVASGQFLVFERPDLEKVRREQRLSGGENLIGVDALIVGAVTEFGRTTEGKVGLLSATKNQIARAKVEVRLVDVKTGQVFFSATGSGEANAESGSIAGFGSRAEYDATLNDRAIGAAVSDVMNTLVSKLQERPWRSDVLKVEGRNVFISGGARQGLKAGDVLEVMQQGERIASQLSGVSIALPPKPLGRLRVVSTFGDNEATEGSVCELVEGTVEAVPGVFVMEGKVQP